jgi:hypothetical protein
VQGICLQLETGIRVQGQSAGAHKNSILAHEEDSRVGGTRTLLRIHPDGAGPGTIGCIGVVGNAAVQRAFRENKRAELARNGGSFNFRVN